LPTGFAYNTDLCGGKITILIQQTSNLFIEACTYACVLHLCLVQWCGSDNTRGALHEQWSICIDPTDPEQHSKYNATLCSSKSAPFRKKCLPEGITTLCCMLSISMFKYIIATTVKVYADSADNITVPTLHRRKSSNYQSL